MAKYRGSEGCVGSPGHGSQTALERWHRKSLYVLGRFFPSDRKAPIVEQL